MRFDGVVGLWGYVWWILRLQSQRQRIHGEGKAVPTGMQGMDPDCLLFAGGHSNAYARLPVCLSVCAPAVAVCLQARHRNPKTPELWLAAIRTEQRAGSTKAAEALLAKGLQVGGGGAGDEGQGRNVV